MSWQKRAQAKPTIYGFTYKDAEGRAACYFVNIDPRKEHSFLQQLKHPGQMDFRDYGEILYSGWGEPPKSILGWLQRTHGTLLEWA